MIRIDNIKRWRLERKLRRTELKIAELERMKADVDAHLGEMLECQRRMRMVLYVQMSVSSGCRRAGMTSASDCPSGRWDQ